MTFSTTKNTFKVSRTYGFYLFECYFRKYQSWPTRDGVRGIVLALINIMWIIYPIIMELQNYKITFIESMFRVQFLITGSAFLIMNTLFLHRGNNLFKLIDALSDFNCFGYPKQMKLFEKTNRFKMKIFNYIGHVGVFILLYTISFDNFCSNRKWLAHEKGITCDLMVAYYVPFKLKPWHQAVLIVFQIYSFIEITYITLGLVLLYSYILKLLILRLQHLTSLIDDIRFKRNQTDNLKLKAVIVYYQDIYKLFQMFNNFMRDIILGPKLSLIVSNILCTIAFLSRPNITNFALIIALFSLLCYAHHETQKLIDAGETVAVAIYNLNWYDAELTIQKDVLTFLTISQRSLTMEIPLIGTLSHLQFRNEFQKTYAWINWILSISKNRRLA